MTHYIMSIISPGKVDNKYFDTMTKKDINRMAYEYLKSTDAARVIVRYKRGDHKYALNYKRINYNDIPLSIVRGDYTDGLYKKMYAITASGEEV